MSYWDKALAAQPAPAPEHPWDSGRLCAPDPALPPEQQLAWYRVFAHCVLLNVSERCRRNGAAEADRELQRREAAAAR